MTISTYKEGREVDLTLTTNMILCWIRSAKDRYLIKFIKRLLIPSSFDITKSCKGSSLSILLLFMALLKEKLKRQFFTLHVNSILLELSE